MVPHPGECRQYKLNSGSYKEKTENRHIGIRVDLEEVRERGRDKI